MWAEVSFFSSQFTRMTDGWTDGLLTGRLPLQSSSAAKTIVNMTKITD